METIIAIDPGTRHCGWAIWYDDHLDYGVINVTAKIDWIERVDKVADEIEKIVRRGANSGPDTEVWVEMPSSYSGGRGEAARNSDAILKLAFLVATIRERLHSMTCRRPINLVSVRSVNLVSVHQWKGQVPKEVTMRRMSKRWGIDFNQVRSDAVDAVGILTYILDTQ